MPFPAVLARALRRDPTPRGRHRADSPARAGRVTDSGAHLVVPAQRAAPSGERGHRAVGR